MENLSDRLKQEAISAGIEVIGITTAEPFVVKGEKERVVDPKEILRSAKSVVVAGFSIYNRLNITPSEPGIPRGRFSSYGIRVYIPMRRHTERVIKQFLKKEGYRAVSSMKIPAKLAAVRASIGKYGKNSVVITERFGSQVMFETLVTDAPLDCEDRPVEMSDCEKCDLCIKSCPTKAIYEPFRVERRRCITNWLWGAFIPTELRRFQENRLFGCAECLMRCPKNEHLKPKTKHPVQLEDTDDSPELIPLILCDREYFKKNVSSFARWAGIDTICANAIIALGNIADPAGIPALKITLHHQKPQIRAYSAWALGKIGTDEAREILKRALSEKRSQKVRGEIESVLKDGENL